jgi:hypothetical protein
MRAQASEQEWQPMQRSMRGVLKIFMPISSPGEMFQFHRWHLTGIVTALCKIKPYSDNKRKSRITPE